MGDRSWESEPKPIYPSPQYRTQSPTRSWATASTPRQNQGAQQAQPYYAQQPPTDSEVQFWQGQPNRTTGYPKGAPFYSAAHYSDHPPPDHNPEESERGTISDLTLLNPSEYGQPVKSPARSKGSQFYTDSDDSSNSFVQQQQLYSPAVGMTSVVPVHAHPLRAEDYLAQRPPTPSASNQSLTTYIRKVKKFVNKVKSLPWAPRDRVTVDYYPGISKRSEREHYHRPMLQWRNPEAYPAGYQSDDMASSTADSSTLPPGPVHGDVPLDLEAEFTGDPATPSQPASIHPSTLRQAFDNPVPVGYPIQLPRPTTWYPDTQPTPMTAHSTIPPAIIIPPLAVPYYQVIPQVVPSQASSQAFMTGQTAVPLYPGGYVPADQQYLGYLYGQAVHR